MTSGGNVFANSPTPSPASRVHCYVLFITDRYDATFTLLDNAYPAFYVQAMGSVSVQTLEIPSLSLTFSLLLLF